jgi:serine/threonine-protein kinase
VELVAGLPDAASCLEPQALPASALAPGDPALAAAVAELREALVEVQIRVRSSQVQAAAAAVEPLVERARAIGWEPILMEALQARGVVALRTGEFAAAERDFVELHALARAQGLPLPELRAAESLSMVVGHHQGRYAEGMAWAETALALVEREPTLAEHEVEVLENKAVLLHEQGKYDEAAALQRRVLVLREGRDDALALASSIDVLGSIVERQGRTHEAIALQRRALELAERELGPEHVTVAVSLNNLASSLIAVGEPAQAVPLLERALRIREREAGPSSPRLVSVLNNLGLALMTEGELEQAELHLQRTLALLEASFPDGHPHVGSALVNLGELYAKQGRLDESRRYAERSFAVWERTLGPTHPKLALVLDSLGKLALREGRAAAALEPLRRALALRESALGAEHPLVAESLVYLGLASMAAGELRQARDLEARAQRALAAGRMDDPALRGLVELLAGRLLLHEGRPAQAIPPLERATGLEGWPEAEAALALAMALWDGGGERSRAVALARQAQASFLALGHATRAEQAERWLLRHRAAPR